MRAVLLCISLFFVTGCASAKPAPPMMGVINNDQHGDWLLYTTNPSLAPNARIYVLNIDSQPRAICCAVITAKTVVPKGRSKFFMDVNSDQPPRLTAYKIKIPHDSVSVANPLAEAVWNVTSVTVTDKGYLLYQAASRATYNAYSCFGSEGLNMFIQSTTTPPSPISHYYAYFGYSIGTGNCKD